MDSTHAVADNTTTQTPDPIDTFDGPSRFLSNFATSPIVLDDIHVATAEAAYHALKTDDRQLRTQIAQARMPGTAKRLGRQVSLPQEWDGEGRYHAMMRVLQAKFRDPGLAARLTDTGTALLVEGNAHHDNHWGTCTCPAHEAQPGQNHLGRQLMRLRAALAPELAGQWTRVAGTGHRALPDGSQEWVLSELHRVLAKLVADRGSRIALSGAATGSDLHFAVAARERGLRTWLYQPFPGHDARWPASWRAALARERAHATRIGTLDTRASTHALHNRNRWLVRDCDVLVAVLDPQRSTGGTVTTVQRARHCRPVIRIDPTGGLPRLSLPHP